MNVRTSIRPVTSLRLLCDAAAELGVDPAHCLEGTGIAPEDLNAPTAHLATEQEIRAIENFARLAPTSVGLGVAVGRRLHVNAFGIWGFAVLTSPTLRSALETSVDYVKLSLVIADMTWSEADGRGYLNFDMAGLPPITHRFVLERHAVVAMTFIRELTQDTDFNGFAIETTDEDAAYARDLSALIGVPVAAGRPGNALTIPAAMFDDPLPKSDPATRQYCLDQCRALLEQVDGALPPWSQKVRDAVVEAIGSEQKIEDIADRLAMTERTLRRRLADEGTSFRDLYTDVRMTLANELLETAGLNVETVAWRVGYAEPASFARAFAKKFGKTPGEVRRAPRPPHAP